MGLFLSFSGIIGKSKDEVIKSLSEYAKSVNGGLEKEKLTTDENNCLVLEESNNNVSILYPNNFLEWEESSEFISKYLNSPVFSFHIHDGSLWMYTFYFNGDIVDTFNPIPDYWDENISEEEIESLKGNAQILTKYIPNLKTENIEKYLIRWDLEAEEVKAYLDDEFLNEDWQVSDFMKKVGFSYPLDDNGSPKSETYKLWTEKSNNESNPQIESSKNNVETKNKPWWKLW